MKLLKKTTGLFLLFLLQNKFVFAASVGATSSRQWPWTRLLNELVEEFTGPLPMTVGILGIAVCAISLYQGNHGGGTQKLLLICLFISLALFAPTLVGYISDSAGGFILN